MHQKQYATELKHSLQSQSNSLHLLRVTSCVCHLAFVQRDSNQNHRDVKGSSRIQGSHFLSFTSSVFFFLRNTHRLPSDTENASPQYPRGHLRWICPVSREHAQRENHACVPFIWICISDPGPKHLCSITGCKETHVK